MKNGFLFLCWLCLAIVLVGCNKNDYPYTHYDEVRKAAWDLLGPESKSEVVHSWEDAQVLKGEFDVFNTQVEPQRYEKHYCYLVSFDTENNALLGPITIFLDIRTLKYLGTSLRL